MSSVHRHLDEAVERLSRLRDELLADEFAPDRSARLTVVFESEARAWSQVFELSSQRLVWRAALAAEAGARTNAALWARRAAAERADCLLATGWAGTFGAAPRPAGLTVMSSDGR
jgi:hypothetical protein